MLSLGITLLVLGGLLGLGSFIFGAVNMVGAISDPFDANGSFEGTFRKHVGCTIGLALGGALGFVGLVLLGFHMLGKAGLI